MELPGLGICSFAHRSFAHSLKIAQDKWANVSESLKSLRTNERLWANRSGRSGQMSDCEQIAQIAHDIWVNVSDLLRLLSEWAKGSQKMSYFTNTCFNVQINVFIFRKTYISNADNVSKKFAGAVFCSWEMSISGKTAYF